MVEMLTFVLVIAGSAYGRPVTVIPGYANRAACEQAAKAYLEEASKGWGLTKNVFCIPGPDRH